MASVRRKEKAAAQADTEPADAGGDDPAWAAYTGARKTQAEKLNDWPEAPITGKPDEVALRTRAYRDTGLIKGRSVARK
eukprot:1519485-Alexandrium_andersonii.AAC.1